MGWGLTLVGRRIFSGWSLPLVRRTALATALPVAGLSALVFFQNGETDWISKGPIQHGHQDLACDTCHKVAPGTARQQIQASLAALFDPAKSMPHFGTSPVASADCLACHQRPNERHPIWRFREPRFISAAEVVNATTCLGCHSEHRDERVNASVDFCKACHEGLSLKVDPLDIPHHEIIAAKKWETCLGCHDFHGNHARKPPLKYLDAHDLDRLIDYLKAGPNPYGDAKLYEAKTR